MFGIVSITFADEFLGNLIESSGWSKFSEQEKTKALNSASFQLSNKQYKKDYFGSPDTFPDELKHAICLQALYLLLDDEKVNTVISEKNGEITSEVKIGGVTTKITRRKSSELYVPVERLIKPFLLTIRFK